jgi:serine/threonine-protein kinase HipA
VKEKGDRLVVWLGDEPVGDLIRTRHNEIRFTRRESAASLTVAPDGAADIWTPSFTRAWFEGLLPEASRRTLAEAEHGVARGDTFGLLAAIGWECAGAVSVLPEGREPASGRYEALTDEEVWERLDLLPSTVSEVDHEVRLSLGGAQDKLLLARLGGGWHLLLEGAVSTHLLKPEPDRHPGLAVGEAWALAVASAATLSASAEYIAPAGHRPTIVVERYDRLVEGRMVRRLHQEDGCQVLGLPPEQKYPRGAGPQVASLARIAAVLFERADDPIAELSRLLEQTVVNVALLNTDAHAKNVSVMHIGPRTVSLSPLYDVAPTVWFLPAQSQVALPVGGKRRIGEIERRHLLAEATGWGIPPREARRIITATLDRVAGGLAAADRRYPDAPDAMRAAVDAQIARLASSTWEPGLADPLP